MCSKFYIIYHLEPQTLSPLYFKLPMFDVLKCQEVNNQCAVSHLANVNLASHG